VQKIGILDLSLNKLLQNEQGCKFLPNSVYCEVKDILYDSTNDERPSVGLSHTGIVSKRTKLGSPFLHRQIATRP